MYHLEDNFTTPVEVTDPQEKGKFFAESCYIVRVTGPKHEYFIHWLGPKLIGDENDNPDEAHGKLVGGVFTSDQTTMRVKKGHEDEAFLKFFPDGFAILDEARIPIADWYAKVAANGVMFRVQAPFGGGARAIE